MASSKTIIRRFVRDPFGYPYAVILREINLGDPVLLEDFYFYDSGTKIGSIVPRWFIETVRGWIEERENE